MPARMAVALTQWVVTDVFVTLVIRVMHQEVAVLTLMSVRWPIHAKPTAEILRAVLFALALQVFATCFSCKIGHIINSFVSIVLSLSKIIINM